MYKSSLLRNSLLLMALAALVIIFTTCVKKEIPQEVQTMQMKQPGSVGPGAMYVLPKDIPDQSTPKSNNSFLGFLRYPAEERDWLSMKEETAYTRDVMVAGKTYISGAQDGDTWTVRAVNPDLNTIEWGYVRFYSRYGDLYDAFVSPWGWIVYNTTSLYITWYYNSQCVNAGGWTMTFYSNDVQFHQGIFQTLPQIPPGKVPLINMLAYTDQMDNMCWWKKDPDPDKAAKCDADHWNPVKISDMGCALAGACMILGYHGVLVNPSTLNTWLTANKEYIGIFIDPRSVAKYARAQGKEVYYVGPALTQDYQSYICHWGPQLAHVRQPTRTKYHHWVVLTGQDESETDWLINDPSGGLAGYLTGRYQDIGDVALFEGPEYEFKDNMSGITIRFQSPGELLITDPQGLRLGYDAITSQSYSEIPNGWYQDEYIEDPNVPGRGADSKILTIMRPLTGDYKLKITGTGNGTYNLSVRTYDTQEGASTGEFNDVPITTGSVYSYQFNFNNESGSQVKIGGGFNGGGQRPRDVNMFLSYGGISSKVIELPGDISSFALPMGTTSFSLQIVYGETIIPGSFTATLDGTDISGLFSPASAKSEIVNIPVHSGRNVLILSVKGNLPGRVAQDTDRLIFIVP